MKIYNNLRLYSHCTDTRTRTSVVVENAPPFARVLRSRGYGRTESNNAVMVGNSERNGSRRSGYAREIGVV